MQVPVFTICYTAANASNPVGRDATGFPLPSMGRGIEGEGWLYLKLPFLLFMQKNSQNSPKYHFLRFETRIHNRRNLPATRQPLGGRARHSVRAAIDIQVTKPSQLPLSQCFPLKKHIMQVPVFTTCYARRQRPNSSGRVAPGGRSRAATPFACGAGTLWRGFAEALRMTLLPSKQPSFPKASLNWTLDRF